MTRISVTEALAPFHMQRQFEGTKTLEELAFCLARASDDAAVEVIDNNEWRFLVPTEKGTISVHCLVAGGQLSVSIYDDEETSSKMIEHGDHWARTYMWTLAVAKAMNQADMGLDLGEFTKRATSTTELIPLIKKSYSVLSDKYKEVFGKELEKRKLSVGISYALLGTDKIGRHESNSEGGIITISPEALDDSEYLKDVVNHELIHFLLGTDDVESHGEEFHALADSVDLPEKYRD